MSIETALYTRGQAVPALTGLIGSQLYYWGSVPQNVTRPYVSFGLVSTVRYDTMSVTNGVRSSRFQFDSWSLQQFSGGGIIGAAEVAEGVAAAYLRFRGTVGGIEIQDILIEAERDVPPDLNAGPESEGLFRRQQDLIVHWDG